MGEYSKDRQTFTVGKSVRRRNREKLEHMKFWLNIQKNFSMRSNSGTGAQRICGFSILGDIQNLIRQDTIGSALKGELDDLQRSLLT